jgi:class 3 adenylate cyclase/tetratricopeptide (TPR) repeat protein
VAGKRRLVTVMLTDMVGFTTLTEQNEAAALRLVEEEENLVRPLLRQFGGREVKTIGDAFLVEFESALEATQCAIELQRGLSERNRRTTSPKLELRIGIHAGDVVQRDEDIYGDTVNIVSRITPTAETGGICVSGPVYEQVRNKIDFSFQPLESRQLKHIDLPVSLFRIELPWLSKAVGRLSPWTGREVELDVIRQKINATQRGEGGVLVLSGEVGIGKSRLAEEAVKQAQRNGFRVLRGRALPGELGVPYSHWADAVREFLRTAPPQQVYKMCGTYAAEIARLVPEISEVIGPAIPGLALEPEQVRFRFFQGIAQFFENLSMEAPLLLFFDELQWADPASLRLLQQAAPRLSSRRLLLLAAYTDSEVDRTGPFQDVLHALHRDHLLTRVRLARLDRSATEALVMGLLSGERPSNALVTSLYELTSGNPFYVEEVLRSLVEEGTVYRTAAGRWDRKSAGEVELPTSIREIVERRLRRLNGEDQRLLSVAAVLGTEFRPGLLAAVAGVPEDALVEPLERMLGAQVIKERSPTGVDAVYVFTDAQLRSMLYEDLSFLRRRGYHQKAATALESSPQIKADDRASELEYHYLRGNDPGKALEYAVKAAERASHLFSHEDAVRHYRTAIELLEATPDERRKFRLLKLLGEAELYLNRIDPGIHALREAAEGLERVGERTEAAELFCSVGSLVRFFHNDPVTSLRFLDRARAILEGQPEGKELAGLYLDTASFLFNEGRVQEASDLRAKARALVERLGDPGLEITIQLGLASEVPVRDRNDVFKYLREAEQIALRHDLQIYLPTVYFSFGINTLEIRGDAPQALEWFKKAVECARKVGDVGFDEGVRRHMFAYVDIKRGELRSAARLTDELFEFLTENFPHPPPGHLCALSEIALLLGNYDRAEELLQLFDSQPPETVGMYCRMRTRNVRGRLSLSKGNLELAEKAFATTRDLFRRGGGTAGYAALGIEALSGLVESRLRSGEVGSAQTTLDELAVLAQAFDEAIGYGYWSGAQGLMAMRQGDPGAAAAAFHRSGDSWHGIGWKYHLAVSLCQLGTAHLGAGKPAEAVDPLRRALEMLTEMGAKPDTARALELLNQATGGGT